jgi:hypothetical protein
MEGRADMHLVGSSQLSRFMRTTLHVNPWRISEIANSSHQALTMTEDTLFRRIWIASGSVTLSRVTRWALAVMLDFKAVHKYINPVQVYVPGLGLGYRILGMSPRFPPLDMDVLAEAYRAF